MNVKLVSEPTLVHAHMDSLFANVVGNAFWKDKDGKYLGANQNELDYFDIINFDDLIGKDDTEIVNQEHANIYRQSDCNVMLSGQGILVTEPVYQNKKIEQYISYKTPLLNAKGKTIGIFGIGYGLDIITSNNIELQTRVLHEILLLAGHSVEALFKQTMLNAKKIKLGELGLSNRQIECLELLAKGMTYKQIANYLCISKRTVEHYIEAIKIKWDCECRYSLIEKLSNS